MEDYKPNSHKYKEEQEKNKKSIEKVVSGKVKVENKTRLKDIFISDDAENIKDYVLMDVLVPAIKKAVRDIVTDGIEMLLYGSTGRSKKSTASYVSYDRFSDKDRRYDDRRKSTNYHYSDIIIDSRGEAEEVLSRMGEIIEEYDVVSVADLYDLLGVPSNYTDNKYGWTNISRAEVERTRDGYRLKLPKALPVN